MGLIDGRASSGVRALGRYGSLSDPDFTALPASHDLGFRPMVVSGQGDAAPAAAAACNDSEQDDAHDGGCGYPR